jgi:hypothetical protein
LTVTYCADFTAECLTVKVALVAPVGIVTEEGTEAAAGSELVKVTTAPPVGAGEPILTFPVTAVEEAPTKLVGDIEKPVKEGASIVTVAV